MSREGIDEIKRRNDLAEVVTEHGIELKRRGRTLFGICPFHPEKTGSFAVSREAGLFHCFGCGAGGDVIGFVVRFHRISFKEALDRLAARAGARLANPSEAKPPSGVRDEKARRLNDRAAARFAWLALYGRQP